MSEHLRIAELAELGQRALTSTRPSRGRASARASTSACAPRSCAEDRRSRVSYSFAAANGAAERRLRAAARLDRDEQLAYLPASSRMTTSPARRERRQRHGRLRRRPAGPRPGTCGPRGRRRMRAHERGTAVRDDDAAARRRRRRSASIGTTRRVGRERIGRERLLAVARAVGRVVLRDGDQREDDGGRDAERPRSRSTASASRPGAPRGAGAASRGAGAASGRSARAAATMRSRRSAGGSLSATASASAAAVSSASS